MDVYWKYPYTKAGVLMLAGKTEVGIKTTYMGGIPSFGVGQVLIKIKIH